MDFACNLGLVTVFLQILDDYMFIVVSYYNVAFHMINVNTNYSQLDLQVRLHCANAL